MRNAHRFHAASASKCMPLAALIFLTIATGCGAESSLPGCRDGNRSQCVTQVAVGDHFACALLADRTVWCWGRNDQSQLGYATTDTCPAPLADGRTQALACHMFPYRVVGLEGATSIAAGEAFACAIVADGAVRCWGANQAGQLGNGATLPSARPVTVQGVDRATSLALGARHACALTETGTVCWGANDRQQLGVAPAPTRCGAGAAAFECATVPVRATTFRNATALVAGALHTCALTSDARVLCVGDNRRGQLGLGAVTDVPSATPRAVVTPLRALDHVTSLAAGAAHTCALRDDGLAYCWGLNEHGELGVPSATLPDAQCDGTCSAFAVPVDGLPTPPAIARNVGAGTGLEGAPGGSSDAGTADSALGPRDAAAVSDSSRNAPGTRDASAGADVVAQPDHSPRALVAHATGGCARLGDSTVRCWGGNVAGQIGNGDTSMDPQRATPVIAGPGAARDNPLQDVREISAGGATVCAWMSDGSVRCWGSNRFGALGIGQLAPQPGPVPVTW